MPIFEVRKNCEYILEIEAEDADLAHDVASNTPDSEWDTAWSPLEVEPADA